MMARKQGCGNNEYRGNGGKARLWGRNRVGRKTAEVKNMEKGGRGRDRGF